jgi:Carbohydrate binding domain/PEP-CTERM motif
VHSEFKMSKLTATLAIAVAIASAGLATGASAAIVNNGSFESGLTGWTAVGGGTTPGIGITVITTGGTNSTGYGDNVANFDGTHAAFFVDDNAGVESLSQGVNLVGGTKYTVSYALYATASGANNPFTFSLTSALGGNILATNTSSQVTVGSWTDYMYTFTAPTTSSYVLDFDFTSGKTPAKDVVLDGVSIAAAVPEPATWAMMLLGFLGLGFLGYRKSSKAGSGSFRVA